MAGTVTATLANNVLSLGLKVYVVTGGLESGGNAAGSNVSPPNASLTPAASSSLILTGLYNETGSTGFTPSTSNTEDHDVAGGGSTEICTSHFTGTVTGGTPVTVGASAPTGQNTAVSSYEVKASIAGTTPVIDASTPTLATGTSPVTSASFTPPAGAVLVAVVPAAISSAATPVITDTFGGLTWTLRRQDQNTSNGQSVSIFTATVPGVGFDNVGPSASGQTFSTTVSPVTWTHVCGSNATAIVIMVMNGAANVNHVTAVTYGGVACSLLGTQGNSGGSLVAFYGLLNPPTGSNTVSVTWATGSGDQQLGGSVSFTGATAFGSTFGATTNGGSAASQAVTVNGTTTGGMIASGVSYGGANGTATWTFTPSGTVRWNDPFSNSAAGQTCAGGTAASTGGGANQTMTWTPSSASDQFAVLAVEVRPAGGAAPGIIVPFRPVTRRFRSRHIRGPWTPHLAFPSGLTTTPISDSDSFSASDTASPPNATLSDADTATGTDAAGPPNATLSSSDTSSGSDSGEKIGVSASDTGSAAEAGSSTATLSGSDTGSASEGGTIGVSASDTATETENQLVSVQITDSDSFSGSDANGTLTVQTSDTASAAEAGTTAASLSSSDSGSASDGGTINVSGSDSGSASDTAGPPNATLSSSDTSSASETGTIGVSASDTGSAAEAASIAATLSSSDTGSASDGNETIRLTSADTGSGSENQGSSASFSTADTASAAEAQSVAASLSSADAASAAESQSIVASLSGSDTGTGTDGGEGGTGGTQIHDTDSWHGEDSGFTFFTTPETASASETEQVTVVASDSFSATDTHTIAWVRSADTATGDDELKTLTGPAVADSDSATATEAVKPFPFSDTDSFAVADNFVLDVWSGMAPYTYLGGRERRIHGPDGRAVATTDHVDPLFLRLAQKIAEADTVEWVSDSDSFGAGEGTFTHDWTVSVSLAPAVRVTAELS